jgi:hypothetical protein
MGRTSRTDVATRSRFISGSCLRSIEATLAATATKSSHLSWRGSKKAASAAVFRTKNADAKHRLWREARRMG